MGHNPGRKMLNAYERHAKTCTRCHQVDTKTKPNPSLTRCDEGIRLLRLRRPK